MSPNPDKPENEKNEPVNWKSELISWIQIIIAAALIALFLNSCIIANSQVPTPSMENTIMAHDRVIGSRPVSYTHLDVYKRQAETNVVYTSPMLATAPSPPSEII